jgi:hypothetical protein
MAREYIDSSSEKSLSASRIFIKYWGLVNSLLIFLVIAGGGFFLLKPKYETAKAAMETDSLKDDIENVRRSLKKMNAMNEAFAEIPEEDKRRVAALIPDEENPESIFPLLETLVQKNGLMTASLEFEEEKEKLPTVSQEETESAAGGGAAAETVGGEEGGLPPEIKRIGINLTVGGADYRGLKSLLDSLENNLRLLDVTEVTFEGEESASLKIYAYFLKR